MANKEITRGQAIEKIIDLMIDGHSIPMCSIEKGGSSISWVNSEDMNLANFLNSLHKADNFAVVPMDEIAKDFEYDGIKLENYDVCVEFKTNMEENAYTEQYLLWGF